MMLTGLIDVILSPTAGFCVKSSALGDGVYEVPLTEEGPAYRIAIPKGTKVFANICFDNNVPPPPEGSEATIRQAMRGEDARVEDPQWFVPVVVSHAQEDKDKAGRPSVVFDCVFNNSVKSRTIKDAQFKLFVIELALQRIEAKSNMTLSRTIGTPNIRSKGTLLPRTVRIPPALYPHDHPHSQNTVDGPKKPQRRLVEEIEVTPKGILKKYKGDDETHRAPVELDETFETPAWTWSRDEFGLQIKIQVPKLKHSDIPGSALDLESQRLLFNAPARYSLDIDLSLTDSETQKRAKTPVAAVNAVQAIALKRIPRQFNVDGGRAEWRVTDGLLIVFV